MRFFYALALILTCFHLQSKSQGGLWTWMKGDTTTSTSGVFGTQGIADPANKPPALYEAFRWTDFNGNLWLFGGVGGPLYYEYAALWKYDPIINEWTWMKGPNTTHQIGVYGTKGVPSINNYPGSRAWGGFNW